MKRPLLVIAAVSLIAVAAPPSTVAASGFAGAADIDTTGIGITDPGSGARFFALSEGRGTALLRIDPDAAPGAQAMKEIRVGEALKFPLKIPAVAMDGTTSGLSADGKSLVLADPYVVPGQAATRMVLVDTDRMRIAKQIRLNGAFAFDAISPDGSRIYLIRYPSPRDPLDYEDAEPGTSTASTCWRNRSSIHASRMSRCAARR